MPGASPASRPRARFALAALATLASLAGVLAAASTAHAGQANPWLDARFLNIAHQGGEDEFPSNTMFALRRSVQEGADMLELDVGHTRDGVLVVLHDNEVDRTTDGTGSVNDLTLRQVQRLDAAYWFVPGRGTVHDLPASRYPYRGVRTGQRRPPRGFRASDFRIPTLAEVMRAFPNVPVNVEIKGRDDNPEPVYRRGADLLAELLNDLRRTDVIVASFDQAALEHFHALAPEIGLAPGTAGVANFLLAGGSPGEGIVAFQIPITFRTGGELLTVTTPDSVRRIHEAGYAVHVWLSNDREDAATYHRLLDQCVDGIMAARPVALERVLAARNVYRPGSRGGVDPCGTRVAAGRAAVSRAGRLTLPLRRRGRSLERRRGTVTLRATHGDRRTVRRGAVLGRARFTLASRSRRTSVTIRLTRAARRALAAGRLRVRAEVRERVPSSRRTIVLRRRGDVRGITG